MSTFQVEYAKSGRGACKKCKGLIDKGEVRIGKEVPSHFHDGNDVHWHHMDCIKNDKKFKEAKATDLKGLGKLRFADQIDVTDLLTDSGLERTAEENERIKEANTKYWEMREKIEPVKDIILQNILEANGHKFTGKRNPEAIVNLAADELRFGRIGECPECKHYELRFDSEKYRCTSFANEFARCEWTGKDAKRYKLHIPNECIEADKSGVLKSLTFGEDYPTEELLIVEELRGVTADTPESTLPEKYELWGIYAYILGNNESLGIDVDELKKSIIEHHGAITNDIKFASVVISSTTDLKDSELALSIKEKCTVVKPQYFVDIVERKDFMKLRSGTDIDQYIVDGCNKSRIVRDKFHIIKGVSKFNPNKPKAGSTILAVSSAFSGKRETVEGSKHEVSKDVDYKGHVITTLDEEFGYTTYNVSLTKTDLDTGANSYYRMTIIAQEKSPKFVMLWEYGRTGTSQGNFTFRTAEGLEEIIAEWEQKFEDVTGNKWQDRKNFKMVPGKYYLQQLSDGWDEDEEERKPSTEAKLSVESKLDSQVEKLMKMIFDKDMFASSLKEMGLDLNKMPLGKIQKSQLLEAYSVLKQFDNIFTDDYDEAKMKTQVKTLTNKYYTLVPHYFKGEIKLLTSTEDIKAEIDLLDTLMNVAGAMSVIKTDATFENYQSLNTKVQSLGKDSEPYKLVEKFISQTTHPEIFREFKKLVDGEEEKYKKHIEDPNRQFLFHGSRLANFVGILSNGLKIAPPEAPSILLVCEVALGKMWETKVKKMDDGKKSTCYLTSAVPGSNSTFAIGMSRPDPKESVTTADGVKVPLGHMLTRVEDSTNTHDEFIVYEEDRVKIRYLAVVRSSTD
ncbi:Poly [ADP-ribose] polymerase [Entamoeba marina]